MSTLTTSGRGTTWRRGREGSEVVDDESECFRVFCTVVLVSLEPNWACHQTLTTSLVRTVRLARYEVS